MSCITQLLEMKGDKDYMFLESLLGHVKGKDEILKARAMWVTWCLNRYFTDGLMVDIENAMREFGEKQGKI